MMNAESIAFNRILTIMDELRAKCPWDKKQTMESLRHLSIEETYELADAILEKDMKAIKGELGDLLLHIIFYSKIASETNDFTITDVINTLCDKLIERHPHIYGDVTVQNEEEVKANWEAIKMKDGRKSALEGVPVSLPAMVKATRIQDKARGIGFDWERPEQVWEKVKEEMEELRVEAEKKTDKVEEELGDTLFALVNYARFVGVNPEDALEKTNRKFIRRFQYMEDRVRETGQTMKNMSLEEMDIYWEEAKKLEKNS
jgi:XTP/dITP diphosphohydrolase